MGYRGAYLPDWFSDGEAIDVACRDITGRASRRMTEVVKMNTPIETGELRAEIHEALTVVTISPLGEKVYEGGSESNLEYAVFVENGTGLWGPKHAKYVIRPRNPNGWLRWIGKDGSPVFAKEVMHPGSPGNHMFAIGVALTEHEFDQIAAPSVERCMNRLENAIHRHGRDGRSLLA